MNNEETQPKAPEPMIEEKSWSEFRATGLMWFVNTTLHMFGWALCYNPNTGIVFPARCKFRGFSEDVITNGYINVSQFMVDNAEQLLKEAKE